MLKRMLLSVGLIAMVALTGCNEDDATVVNRNLIKAADNFEVSRRIVFYNGITDSYMLVIEGQCAMDLNNAGTAFNVVCKTGPDTYKRHTQVLSDNTSAFVEQLEPVAASAYHYRVTFKPQTILPDIDFRGDADELMKNRN